MITNARVKQLIQLNLRDERMTSSALFVGRIIERRKHGAGVDQYRIKNLVTGEFITSLDEFIDQIDESKLHLTFPYEGERLQTDRVTGFLVTLDQYEVQWSRVAEADKTFSSIFDINSQKHFQFCLVYMNDGDEELPLKISYPKLVRVAKS